MPSNAAIIKNADTWKMLKKFILFLLSQDIQDKQELKQPLDPFEKMQNQPKIATIEINIAERFQIMSSNKSFILKVQ